MLATHQFCGDQGCGSCHCWNGSATDGILAYCCNAQMASPVSESELVLMPSKYRHAKPSLSIETNSLRWLVVLGSICKLSSKQRGGRDPHATLQIDLTDVPSEAIDCRGSVVHAKSGAGMVKAVLLGEATSGPCRPRRQGCA